MSMRNREGFTLLELMVVTIIIGVLASLALAAFGGVREKAMVGAARAEVRNLLTAAEAYRSVNGLLPASLDDLLASGLHVSSENIDYCDFTRVDGPPADLRVEAAHRGSTIHLVAQYPSWGVEMKEGQYASDCR